MSELSELEMRVLSELEEAGQEDIITMMVTVLEPTGHARDIEGMQSALENLVRRDLIRMSMDRDPSGRLRDLSQEESLKVVAGLKSYVHFNREKAIWVNAQQSGPPFGDPFPYIVDTASGKKMAFEILDERGYQWWRPRR